MTITKRNLQELITPDYNPRTISKDEFNGLLTSLETFGYVDLLVVNKRNNHIVGGNQRAQALKQLGFADIDVVEVDLDDHDERKLNVVLNSQAISGVYDDLKLSELLEAFKMDSDYQALRLNELEPLDLSEQEIEEDDAPELSTEPPISKRGEVYQLGRHRLMCGDATSETDIETLMDGTKADMVFTDPPYGVNFSSNMRTTTAKFDVLQNDDRMLDTWIPLVVLVSKGFVFVWTSWKVLSAWQAICAPFGDLTNVVVWNKGGGGIGDLTHTFSTDYELALVYNRGNEIIGKRIGSVWDISKDNANSYQHPTQKPVALAAQAIQSTTVKGNSVLDVFGGSGSTLIAAEQTDRTCYMMELDEQYVDVIRKRYHKFVTGNEDGWQEGTPVIL